MQTVFAWRVVGLLCWVLLAGCAVPQAMAQVSHEDLKRQADDAYRQGRYDQTVELTSRVIRDNTADAVALYLRASARIELGIAAGDAELLREGIHDAREAIRHDQAHNPDYYLPYLYGMTHLSRVEQQPSHAEGTVSVATTVLNRSDLRTEARGNLLYQRALARSQLGQVAEAAADLRQTIQIVPRHLAAHLALADVLAKSGDAAGAESTFAQTVESFPSQPLVFNNRGMFYQSQGRAADAIRDFTTALQLDNDYLPASLNRGFSLLRTGDPEAAIGDFTHVIDKNPQHAGAHQLRGTANLALGDVAAAIDDYRTALELAPEHLPAHADLGFAFFFDEQYAAAATEFAKAQQADDSFRSLSPWRYAALRLAGETATAEQAFREVVSRPAEERDWVDLLTLALMGQVNDRELLAAVDSTNRQARDAQLCEAYYFLGLRKQMQSEQGADVYFRRAAQSQATKLSAYRGAQFALGRFTARK